jgi:DNA-binding NarL/FixJ family response regulator
MGGSQLLGPMQNENLDAAQCDSRETTPILEEGLRQLSETVAQGVRAYHALVITLLQSMPESVSGQAQDSGAVLQELGRLQREREQERLKLTNQEVEILHLAATGLNNRDIGAHQFWSEITIKRKMGDIYRKLAVRNRAQAVAEAVRLGII